MLQKRLTTTDIQNAEDVIQETMQSEEYKISNTTNDKIAKIWSAVSIISVVCGCISGIVLGNMFPTRTLDLPTSIYDTVPSYTSSFNYNLMIYVWLASLFAGFIFFTIGTHIQNQQQIIHLLQLQVKDKDTIRYNNGLSSPYKYVVSILVVFIIGCVAAGIFYANTRNSNYFAGSVETSSNIETTNSKFTGTWRCPSVNSYDGSYITLTIEQSGNTLSLTRNASTGKNTGDVDIADENTTAETDYITGMKVKYIIEGEKLYEKFDDGNEDVYVK